MSHGGTKASEKASHGSPFLSLEVSHGGTGRWGELMC